MWDPESARCYRCREFGHVSADCPDNTPAARALAPTPADAGAYWRPPPVPDRRMPEEIGDAAAWAAKIRAAMGWAGDGQDDRLQRLAREQVRESRAVDAIFVRTSG